MNISFHMQIIRCLMATLLIPVWMTGACGFSCQKQPTRFLRDQTQALNAPSLNFIRLIKSTHIKALVCVQVGGYLAFKYPGALPLILSGMSAVFLQEDPLGRQKRVSLSWAFVLITITSMLFYLGFSLGDVWTFDILVKHAPIYSELLIASLGYWGMLASIIVIGVDYLIKSDREIQHRADFWRIAVPLSMLLSWHDGIVWGVSRIVSVGEKVIISLTGVALSFILWINVSMVVQTDKPITTSPRLKSAS